MKYRCQKSLILILFTFLSIILSASVTQKVLISEFLALNSSIKTDVDGAYSDWIELYNPGETAVDLTGWHLTDEASNLTKWTFPSLSIGSGQYLLVWASGKDVVASNGEIHTNFKLSGTGEYLALVEPDTNNISFEYAPTFPTQQSDVSYGIFLGQQTYFRTPTPGTGNSMGIQLLTPTFSVSRGFFSTPFTVSLSVADPSSTIRYTTDGIRPTAIVGNLYNGPITISNTTALSAVCVKEGVASAVVSNTYLFVSDIVNQPNTPVGYPEKWGTMAYGMSTTFPAGSRAPADYGMDPDVCNNSAYKNLMDNALTSIPTLSIVTNPSHLFSYSINKDTGGIYIYTGDVPYDEINIDSSGYTAEKGYPWVKYTSKTMGVDWERPASVEYFDPSDSSQFQINCALMLHGGNGRKAHSTPKHSFRLSFRSEYGASKLNFKIFDEKKAADQFDHLIVRAAMNYSWLHNAEIQRTDAQNLTDAFSRKLQLDMGQVSGHDKFVHVYINGMYWGVFDLTEKFNNDFMSSYFGGNDTDYDVVNDDGAAVDGSMTMFNAMKTNALAGKYTTLLAEKQLDFTNFIDYMLMNFYIGNMDWDGNNWLTSRSTVNPEEGFRFFSWDAENSLANATINRVTLKDGTPTRMFNALAANTEFKMILADRIQKHFFNGGALTPENTIYRYGQMAGRFDTAMIAESARWGDFRRDHAITNCALYTLNDHWLPRRNYLINTYFPQRTTTVFNQLKSSNFFPTLVAPAYNTRGGEITNPVSVTISAPAGTIYYTIDGTDPRVAGGSLSSKAITYSKALNIIGKGTLKARAKSGSVWSAINEVSFKSADTLHFIGNGSGLPILNLNQPLDIYYSDNALHYQLPSEGKVSLQLYTLDGRVAGGFESRMQNAGVQSYEFKQGTLQSGIYLYKMYFNNQIQTGKLSIR